MTEIERLAHLFDDLYDGNPWIDVTLVGTLAVIDAQKAAFKPEANRNSIWEIVNHLIAWRKNVLRRVQGEILVSPEDNYFRSVEDQSDGAWEQTKAELAKTQSAWQEFLGNLSADALEKVYPPNGHSYAEHLHGILQHDAYHLGQIVLLAKHL